MWKDGQDTMVSEKLERTMYNAIHCNLFLKFFWLCWVFGAVCGLSLVVVCGGYTSLQCAGFSLQWLLFVAEHRL